MLAENVCYLENAEREEFITPSKACAALRQYCSRALTTSQLKSIWKRVRIISGSDPLRNQSGLESAGNMQAQAEALWAKGWGVELYIKSNQDAAKQIDAWAKTEHDAGETRKKIALKKRNTGETYTPKPFDRSGSPRLPRGNLRHGFCVASPLKYVLAKSFTRVRW